MYAYFSCALNRELLFIQQNPAQIAPLKAKKEPKQLG